MNTNTTDIGNQLGEGRVSVVCFFYTSSVENQCLVVESEFYESIR